MAIVINDVEPRTQVKMAAGETEIDVPFPFLQSSDLTVYQRAAGSTANDANDITTAWSAVGAGNANGGTVTLATGASAGDIVTIVRTQDESRTSLYSDNRLFNAENLDDDFSKELMLVQQNSVRRDELTPTYQVNDVITSGDLWLESLEPGESWRMAADGSKLEAFTASSGTSSSTTTASSVQVSITQTAHGLAAGNVVYVDASGNYVTSQADTAANAEVVGIVNAVTDANTFVLQMGGIITAGLSGLTAGSIYYLSPSSAGDITATRPTTAGQVVKPVLMATATGAGIWLNYLGSII